MINYIALTSALLLSVVSAYFSIVGLTTIFQAAFWPVVTMGMVLEIAKLVSASWLYRNRKICPPTVKYYLIVAIVILMMISSMGIFGYLSKAHSEVASISGSNIVRIQTLDQQIQIQKERIDYLLKQSNKTDKINRRIDIEVKQTQIQLEKLTNERLPLLEEHNKIIAELGPLKYIAELIYGSANEEVIGKAVRTVIISIVFVFDPLAIALVIAANFAFAQIKKDNKVVDEESKKGIPLMVDPETNEIFYDNGDEEPQIIEEVTEIPQMSPEDAKEYARRTGQRPW